MNLPNLITIFRILMVPLTVWLIISHAFMLAFVVFVIAGLSDGVDGYLARRFDWKTELGAYLDPLADKALLVSIFVALGILSTIPAWLVILVVTRDVLIVGAVILSWLLAKPMAMQPLLVSKVNTVAQIGFAGIALLVLGSKFNPEPMLTMGAIVVSILTAGSGVIYMRQWLHHMTNGKVEGPRH